jgi:HAUS augmin-like complex subunit 6 N-terminus
MLEEAKKHGLLGRETILRRTMLDDCKSDKLLEILVVFSTTVVRKFVAPELLNDRYHSVVGKLATSPILNSSQQEKLAPMIVAHRASLDTLLRRKAETRARCQTFAKLLHNKSDQLAGRMTACKQEEARVGPPDQRLKARVEREVFGNWPGSNSAAWPHTLLYGDETPAEDQPLKRSFQGLWDVVARGGVLQPDPDSIGLVESLEQRVTDQKERLRKWQTFHDGLLHRSHIEDAAQHSSHNDANAIAAFRFESHQDLTLSSVPQQDDTSPFADSSGNAELEDIVMTLKKALFEVSVSKPGTGGAAMEGHDATRPRAGLFGNGGMSHIRQQVPILEYPDHSKSRSPSWTDGQAGKGLMNMNQMPLSNIFSPAKQPFPSRSNTNERNDDRNGQTAIEDASNDDGERHVNFDYLGLGVVPESTMNNLNGGMDAGYSKSASRMSLADRTRLSMSQANNGVSQSYNPEPSALQSSKEANVPTSVITISGPSVADRRASLLERTQQSMSNLALAMSSTAADPLPHQRSSRPRPSSMFQLSVKRQRQSLAASDANFPVNQFETPGKPRAAVHDDANRRWRERNATPTEKLFSGDADYTSVFKSRPRVERSPDPSLPGTPVYDDSDILEEDEDFMSSPLRGKG